MTDRATSQAHLDRSTAWVAFASVVLGVLNLISTLICLRMLWVTTADFGVATLAIALFPILDRLGGLQVTSAIVQARDTDPRTLSSIFWLGLGASIALVGLLAAGWPLLGALLPHPIIGTLLLAYAGRNVLRHLGTVPEAMLRRDLRYRELSIVRIGGQLAEGVAKIGFAYLGSRGFPALAIWCFVLGPVANTVVTAIGAQLYAPWWPRLTFDRAIAVRAARFTASISGGELLYFAYTSSDYLVIGTYFGDAAVGAYRLAYELVLDVVRLLSMVTVEVAFSAFVRIAGDRDALGPQLLRFARQNLILLTPFLVFVGIEADDLLALLYPPLPAAAALAARILCLLGVLRTLGLMLPPLLAGIGKASRVFAYHTMVAAIIPLSFVATANLFPDQGYVGIAWAWGLGYSLALTALLAMSLPLAGVSAGAYVRATGRVLLCTAGALAAGLVARVLLPDDALLRVVVVIPIVIGAYALLLARLEHVTLAAVVRNMRARS